MVAVMMSLDDRVLHAYGGVHGVARCGEEMRDPWMAGGDTDQKAIALCEACFDVELVPA